jgi:hypothetical protein
MKDGLKHIIGRQIAAVIVAKSDKRSPRNQVFLVFTDGSNFELYGDAFTCCGDVDRTRDIARYIASGGGQVVRVYTDPAQDVTFRRIGAGVFRRNGASIWRG